MSKRKYFVRVIRWEPQEVCFELEVETALEARHTALEKVRAGDFTWTEIDSTIPVRTTLMSCNRVRKTS